jgi:hypothetical protein
VTREACSVFFSRDADQAVAVGKMKQGYGSLRRVLAAIRECFQLVAETVDGAEQFRLGISFRDHEVRV